MQQDCYVTMEMQLVYRSRYQENYDKCVCCYNYVVDLIISN
jgi:hypothetical protein